MSRRKQAKPIRHLDDGTPTLNGKALLPIMMSVKLLDAGLNKFSRHKCLFP